MANLFYVYNQQTCAVLFTAEADNTEFDGNVLAQIEADESFYNDFLAANGTKKLCIVDDAVTLVDL